MRGRLLGCELTYHRSPPRVGETITYDIHVDGHATQGPIRIFFFHYDCRVRPLGTGGPGSPDYQGKPLLTVRNGQAGFFTTKELDESAGILAYLYEHMANPLFQCRFRWTENAIAFWDNRCAQHRAMWDYWPHTRAGTRVTVKGERPV